MSLFGSIFGVDGIKDKLKDGIWVVAILFVLDILTRLFIPCGTFAWWNHG